jgi:uroporphyrinogen III methyltransferase/synthase
MVTVVTGHPGSENTYSAGRDAARLPGVDWAGLSPRGTLVVLMGIAQLPDIVRRLRDAGWKASTPAAVVRWGSLPDQVSVDGTLADIVARVRLAGIASPAVVVVGEVVSLRGELNWFERLPLFGRTVLVTRAAHQAGDLADALERRGARVLFSASIEMRPLPGGTRYLRRIGEYDGVLFSSVNAARLFAERWAKQGRDWPEYVRILAVGVKTAAALASAGLPVHRIAREFVAESLAAAAKSCRKRSAVTAPSPTSGRFTARCRGPWMPRRAKLCAGVAWTASPSLPRRP